MSVSVPHLNPLTFWKEKNTTVPSFTQLT